MENKVWKELISRRCASSSPNYERKSHGYGEISIFMGRAADKYLMEMPRKPQGNSHTMG